MDVCLANKTNIGDLSYLTAKNNLLLGFHITKFLSNHQWGKTCLQKENKMAERLPLEGSHDTNRYLFGDAPRR